MDWLLELGLSMIYTSNKLISYRTRLKQISASDVGGKGWNLFRLLHFGFPIPAWCLVSTSVFKEVVGVERDRIRIILSEIDFSDRDSVEHASSRIRAIVIRLELPEELYRELFVTLGEMSGRDMLFSVRSSVVGEDSAEHSFAGQMDSFLNVPSLGVIAAIKNVWASAFSSRALVYRKRKSLSLEDVSSAVIIQEMVQSVASGVLFTRDPEMHTEKCVISAAYGLGEGVVANLVETDTYRIGWDSADICKEVSRKDYRLVRNTTTGTGNRKQNVAPGKQFCSVLTDAQIRELRDVAVKAERRFGAPQDIEWAFNERRVLFVLQARPIVFGSRTISDSPLCIWESSNIVESYPGLTLPLTFSFVRTGYEVAFRNVTLSFVFLRRPLKKKLHIFKNMIGLLNGRIYYNLLNWYEMLSFLPGFQGHKRSWDQMIGISKKIEFPQTRLSMINRLFSLLNAAWRLLTVQRNGKRFFSRFRSVYKRFQNVDVSGAHEDELIAVYESLTRQLSEKWHLTLVNDFCAMKYYDWLRRLCDLWGLSTYANVHNNLLCGDSAVESVAPVRSLVSIAEMVRTHPSYRALISEDDDSLIWGKVQCEVAYKPLKEALDGHIREFGDRGMEELKLESSSFRERPELLIGLINNYASLGLSVATMENQEREIRTKAERFVRHRLKNPFKRLVFRFILKNARRAITNRENMRFARSRFFGVVKRLFRRMGDLFVEKGLLESSSDIYYLTVDEIFGIVQGTAVTQNLTALVDMRRAEYAGFAQRTLKERIETRGIPYLAPLTKVESVDATEKTLKGIGCSSGIARGKARLVLNPTAANGNGEHILVARSTDPGWVFLMVSAKGIVVEKGSVLSHTAIIGRELGIPTIIGVKEATRRIPDGATVSMDGSTGEIRWQ